MKCTEPPSSKMELKCVGVDTFKLLSQDWDLLAASSDVRVGDQTTWGESERPRFKSQACQFTTYGTWAKLLNLSKSQIPHLKNEVRDFPSGPVAKTLCFQCRGCRFNPWSGN